MAIVTMKKLRVVAMAEQRADLLEGLLRLGCVEISEPEGKLADPAWSALLRRETSSLAAVRTELADAQSALAALERYGEIKSGLLTPRETVSKQKFLSQENLDRARAARERISERMRDLSRLESEETRLRAKCAALQPWKSLDVPLETEGTDYTVFRKGICPGGTDTGALRTALAASEAAVELYEIGADKQQTCYVLICHKAEEATVQELLRPWNFSVTTFQGVTGTAAENLRLLEQQLAENQTEQTAAKNGIAALSGEWNTLRQYVDRLNTEVGRGTSGERILTDGTVLFFEGWVPAEELAGVAAFLDSLSCAWEAADPVEEDIPEVPVKLKNNWFTQPLNMVTNMYILPTYDSLDPNPLMAPFFITFYGLMMADMGYGLLMLLGAWFMLKKMKARGGMRDFAGLLGLCGVSTLIWGALTGGFFGDFITQLMNLIKPGSNVTLPYLFTPLTDTLMILIGSLVLGVIQIFTGMAINVVVKFKKGNWRDALWDEFTWWIIFAGAGLAVLGIGNVAGYPAVLLAGIVMLLYSGTRGRKGFGKVTGIIGTVYNGVSGYFSDILSYARLMALMLAGAVIAQVFNTLGSVTGNVVTFVLVSFLGNILNFALNLLGCYVHDLRLQCLEFFNRFYSAGGRPFKPLEIQTKYVDLTQQK